MLDVKKIEISDYSYSLPKERIAQFPLKDRDKSKLLVYKDNSVLQDFFYSIADYIPENTLLILNDTKVIPVRLFFQKPTGSIIEIFCLSASDNEFTPEFLQKNKSVNINCYIGNAVKWKSGTLQIQKTFNETEITLSAEKISHIKDYFEVKLEWTPSELSFAEILDLFGETPLPVYIKRKADEKDNIRYQTVFAEHDGSVAAPTAGLHFTKELLQNLKNKNIQTEKITLNVGAGTFKPVKTKYIGDHSMHKERFIVSLNFLKKLFNCSNPVCVVGTTALRTIESLYYIGMKIINKKISNLDNVVVEQWQPYYEKSNIDKKDALSAIIKLMGKNGRESIQADTSIIIVPSFEFKFTDILITNYHQPKSTLLLLVSAFIGENWRKVYDYAVNNDFRFLSYGDSSILIKNKMI